MKNSNENQPPVPPSGYDPHGSSIQPVAQPEQKADPQQAVPEPSQREPEQPASQQPTSQQPAQQPTAQQPPYQQAAQPSSYGQHGQYAQSQQNQYAGGHQSQNQAGHQGQYAQGQQQTYRQPVYNQAPAPAAAAAKAEKKGTSLKTFLIAFAGAALACIIALVGYGFITGGKGAANGTTAVLGSTSSTDVSANDDEQSLAEAVAEKALPSIVSIDVYSNQSSYYGFGGGSSSDELTQSSLGSGVVLSEDGYIITNYHVIEGGDSLIAVIEGEEYECEVVGTDPSSDLAVLKAKDASGLTPIEIGSSADLTIGEWVMTLGSPFGLEQSVATGIVSATSRSQIMQSESGTAIYANMIQTDAAINPGNSGGALVDADGKLIGINTLITSSSGNYSGVGFAIPVDYAINIAQQIIEGGTPTHAQLGVSLSNVDAQTAQRYGLSVDKGAYVSRVYSGSGAEAAGIKEGDIITKFNNNAIDSASDLMLDVRSMNPGDKVTIEINRSGETVSVEVTLGSDSSTQNSTRQQDGSSLFGGSGSGSLSESLS